MARPTKLFLDYFSHDTDAVNDEKMELFRSAYGNDGYAFYFIILERIYKTEGAVLDLSKNIFVLGLAKKLFLTIDKFNEMLETAFELEMFDRELYEIERKLTSNGIQKRYEEVMKQRKAWNKQKKNDESIEFSNEKQDESYEFSNEKTMRKTTQRKGKEKEKEIEIKKKINNKENNNDDSNESTFSFSDDVIYLSNLLRDKMIENNPNCKLPSDYKRWNNEIRLMMDNDGYTFTQIDEMIRWSQNDDFWRSNILSAPTLRKQAGKLVLGMKRNVKPKSKSFMEEMQELMDYANGVDNNGQATNDTFIDVDCIEL